jgi:hypothetical protein
MLWDLLLIGAGIHFRFFRQMFLCGSVWKEPGFNDSSFTFSGNDVYDDPYQGWLFGKFKKIIF